MLSEEEKKKRLESYRKKKKQLSEEENKTKEKKQELMEKIKKSEDKQKEIRDAKDMELVKMLRDIHGEDDIDNLLLEVLGVEENTVNEVKSENGQEYEQ